MKRLLAALVLATITACAGSATAKRRVKGVEAVAVKWVETHVEDEIAFVEKTVNINSGTLNLAGVKAVADVYTKEFEALGMEVSWVALPKEMQRAGHLIARSKAAVAGTGRGQRLVLIGHLDTVFEKNSAFQKFERKGKLAKGPGVIDMKGGNAVILYALKALHHAKVLDDIAVTVVFTGDEEHPGLPLATTRQPLIDAIKASDVALGFESLVDHLDTATIARRGFQAWELRVQGQQGHSSQVFSETFGYGAIYEAARILNAFREKLAGEENVTFSPGRMAGGTSIESNSETSEDKVFGKRNVIPKEVVVVGDLRVLTPEQLARIETAMKTIVSENLPGTTATLEFEEGYPPMAPTEGNQGLFAVLATINQDLGRPPLEEVPPSKRGAADISFAAPFVPSMGGLGLLGKSDHTPDEEVDLASVPVATVRAAMLIYRLGTQVRRD